MHLSDLQSQAWRIAESKGLHANLDAVTHLGAREQALLRLAPVYQALNTLTQAIKRRGVSPQLWSAVLSGLIVELEDEIADFEGSIMLEEAAPLAVEPGDRTPASIIRLMLTHTEIDEGIEALQSDMARRDILLSEELADAVIRISDLAETLGLNLDEAVAAKLATNAQRPMFYGTPAQQTSHDR